MPKLLFIIGMQKSGTSLLNRMLMQQSVIKNPFLPEGKFFWGDNPPFTPSEKPCGELYQNHNGAHGHYLNKSDYRLEDEKLLLDRINEAAIDEPILMNKNPYNSVRIAWLKKVFPDCIIVAMIRNPVANVYSLLKKYQISETQGHRSEDGWWGIKPMNWKGLVSENKIKQCSLQWYEVNQEIIKNIDNVDMLVDYEYLCANPNQVIQQILNNFNFENHLTKMPKCKNLNDEYKQGSRLLSKNQEFRNGSGFDLSEINDEIEIQPLNNKNIEQIKIYCSSTWRELKEHAKS